MDRRVLDLLAHLLHLLGIDKTYKIHPLAEHQNSRDFLDPHQILVEVVCRQTHRMVNNNT